MPNKHVDLFKDIIPSVDMGLKELWDAATDEGKKEIKGDFWTLNRYISNTKTSKKTQFHEWIPLKKQKNKKEEFLAGLFPNMKLSDVAALAEITDLKEVKKYCEDLGWDKKQVNAIKL